MSKKRRSKYGPRLKIVGQFIPHPAALIRILRGLSPTARRILDTLELEHCRHGGRDNGRLRYTYDDFEDDGISRSCIAPALRQLKNAGIVKIKRGRRAYADFRIPNIFTLTYLPTFQDGRWLDATNEWEKQNTRPEFSTGTRPESSTITRPETDTTGGAYAGFPRPESDTPIYNLGRKGGGLRYYLSRRPAPSQSPGGDLMTEYMDIGCDAKRAPQSAVASEQPLQSTALAALDHALTAWWLTQTASSDHIRPMPSWRLGMHWREGASASCWQPLQGQAKPCWHQPSCPASWIGFVTDIVHEELDDGKTKQTKKDRDKIKLPKECPACAYLRPAGTNKCPNCGFEAKPQNKIRVVDGELKELNSAKRPTNGRDLKAEIYAQFKGYAEEKGYKPGFAYHKFREYFGEEPRGLSNVPSQSPSPEIRSWLKSRFIAFYKATHPPQVSQVQVGPWQRLPMPSGLPTSVARKVGAVYIARSFREMAGMQNVDIANFGV